MKRRQFLRNSSAAVLAIAPLPVLAKDKETWLKLAVQQYTFNGLLKSGKLDMLDYAKTVVEGTGIKALEYYNGHYDDKAGDTAFFRELRKRSDDLGAVNTLMLCRNNHALDSSKADTRAKSVEAYRPWLEATKILGGQWIRVDARSGGDLEENRKHAVAGLEALSAVAKKEFGIGILVENHGGNSGNGKWMASVMKEVNLDHCGTLPDFQNFKGYDPYLGVEEMMPWAKVVCAKSKAFDDQGNESNVDYRRMLKIVKDAGYQGYIGIEFEGHTIDPIAGILATKKLIEKVMAELS